MTYKQLKSMCKGLLVGDNSLPQDQDEMLGLVELAFYDIATNSLALRLLTLDKNTNILRMAQGNYLTRFPILPSEESDVLDIDHELCYAAARLIASYVSKNKPKVHFVEAKKIINDYNAKVTEIEQTVSVDDNGNATILFPEE